MKNELNEIDEYLIYDCIKSFYKGEHPDYIKGSRLIGIEETKDYYLFKVTDQMVTIDDCVDGFVKVCRSIMRVHRSHLQPESELPILRRFDEEELNEIKNKMDKKFLDLSKTVRSHIKVEDMTLEEFEFYKDLHWKYIESREIIGFTYQEYNIGLKEYILFCVAKNGKPYIKIENPDKPLHQYNEFIKSCHLWSELDLNSKLFYIKYFDNLIEYKLSFGGTPEALEEEIKEYWLFCHDQKGRIYSVIDLSNY